MERKEVRKKVERIKRQKLVNKVARESMLQYLQINQLNVNMIKLNKSGSKW